MWPKLLTTFSTVAVLAMAACSSAGMPTVTTGDQSAGASTPASTSVRPVASTEPSTPSSRTQSGEQAVWTNEGEETNTLLVTLRSSQGQLEQGESTLITASANNVSGSPLDVGLIIQLGAGLTVSSSTGCTGDPCSTGRFSVAGGQQTSASVHVALETGAVRNSYELILNYEYTDPETGERKTGRIDGELTSGDYAPTPTPYPTYTPYPTSTPYQTAVPAGVPGSVPTPTARPMPVPTAAALPIPIPIPE